MPDADLGALAPWAVTYPSAGRNLAGYWFVPERGDIKGALIVNHGSGGFRPTIREVAEEFNRLGYAAFLPVRRGYHDNPGPHWRSHLTAAEASPAWGRQVVDALLQENDDVLAALDWLTVQAGVDAGRIGGRLAKGEIVVRHEVASHEWSRKKGCSQASVQCLFPPSHASLVTARCEAGREKPKSDPRQEGSHRQGKDRAGERE